MVSIKVEADKCDGCGECADVCPSNVYEIIEGKAEPVNIDECIECCSCAEICPNNAISHDSC